MPSENARATSLTESRFRLDAPNSRPRALTVVALDSRSEPVVRRLAKREWNGANFLTASAFSGPLPGTSSFSVAGWLSDLAGRATDLMDETARTDLMVVIGTAGEDMPSAAIIAEACQLRHVPLTAMMIGPESQSDEAMAAALQQLRPYASMLVIAREEDYLVDMLTALRA